MDASGFTQIYSCSVFETCGVERFHKDGKRAYIQTNKGDADESHAVLGAPRSGDWEARM